MSHDSSSQELRPPRISTIFPYTTLFRSEEGDVAAGRRTQEQLAVRRDDGNSRARHDRAGIVRRRSRFRCGELPGSVDRKSTRLNSSHLVISYAVFCLKKKQYHNRERATD